MSALRTTFLRFGNPPLSWELDNYWPLCWEANILEDNCFKGEFGKWEWNAEELWISYVNVWKVSKWQRHAVSIGLYSFLWTPRRLSVCHNSMIKYNWLCLFDVPLPFDSFIKITCCSYTLTKPRTILHRVEKKRERLLLFWQHMMAHPFTKTLWLVICLWIVQEDWNYTKETFRTLSFQGGS